MRKSKLKVVTPVNMVGLVIITMAGWLDSLGLQVFFKERSSSMTGRAAALSSALTSANWPKVIIVIIIILSFIMGASIGTRQAKRHGLTGGLLTSAFFLFLASSLIFIETFFAIPVRETFNFTVVLVPMALGCMNASCTLSPIGSATHLTGSTTALGISLSNRDWNGVIFYGLRWVGFLTGAILGLLVHDVGKDGSIPLFLAFLIPSILITITALVQKEYADIPLK